MVLGQVTYVLIEFFYCHAHIVLKPIPIWCQLPPRAGKAWARHTLCTHRGSEIRASDMRRPPYNASDIPGVHDLRPAATTSCSPR
jgi:hypothetical protein